MAIRWNSAARIDGTAAVASRDSGSRCFRDLRLRQPGLTHLFVHTIPGGVDVANLSVIGRPGTFYLHATVALHPYHINRTAAVVEVC